VVIYEAQVDIMECERGLNDRDKHLRVKNLLIQWKAHIICLQKSKLELISKSLVRCVWGYWCYSASRRAFGRILLMWDRRVGEKIKECGGGLRLPDPLEMSRMVSLGLLRGVCGPNFDCD
jgi:hypothetical protein